MRPEILIVFWGASLVRSAINLNGTKAVAPLREDDPSPIADPNTYYPDQHDCPLPCADYTNIHSWITYFSIDRLHRCQEPMLLKFSISQSLDDPTSNILIRSCTLGTLRDTFSTAVPSVENPKKASKLSQGSLGSAPACIATGNEAQDKLQLGASSGSNEGAGGETASLLKGMQSFFNAQDNCDENFLFAYHKRTVAGIYIGSGLGKPTISSALQAISERLQSNGVISNRTIAELCSNGRLPERTLGISVDTTGDFLAVQNTALEWSHGKCAIKGNIQSTGNLVGVKVLEIASSTNSTLNATSPTSRIMRRAPSPDPDGTCATHLIVDMDTCDKLAKQYGVTVTEIEKWNKGKTWAWTECKDMLVGYNMFPGTQKPSDKSLSLADLNPCPLKACCSNWGFCGVFPAHCDIHKPEGGGPGSKEKGYQNTCVSSCSNEIKKVSNPPKAFQRIGYYESYNFERECLWLKSKNANTDGTYTHMHWAFADIDPTTWKLVIKDKAKQWEDFKKLKDMRRIVSIGGWAYSTEAATYNIIRSAIIENRDKFAANLAQFAKDEGIDGIDIDWEYPGAPDIEVGGKPIGQKSDGANYLKFLTVLKRNLGSDRSVSIAAPASYWYLKAFPIDKIASVIDYIVYMTYDLHGQWDYGNPNAYDSCPSGKCIRSHVNLTETRNSLAMITKAGAANNKIFVGEASYGRSFHMAVEGCWGPTCDFTGSRTQSDAAPGRCTKTGGYLGYAEINELIKKADGARTFHDTKSNTDVMIYKGDYISYMTPETKDTRRDDWKSLNFAGSIDWAVDLQSFTADDMGTGEPERPKEGEGCVSGDDITINSGDLCEFSCNFGFCPESLCMCTLTGEMEILPPEKKGVNVIAWDESDVDLNRLCKFACRYGYCPDDVCTTPIEGPDMSGPVEVGDDNEYFNYTDARWQNSQKCVIFQDPKYRDVSVNMCKPVCQDALDEAKEEGRTSNYGCMGFFPLDKGIPWEKPPGTSTAAAPGQCLCDNWLLNEIADTVLEALPMIAQIGCYILMSSIKLVLDVGLQFIPGVGKILDAGLDMATTAAQMAAYLYPEEEDPEGAFSWWLSPCGGTDLVPEDIKKAFGILSQVAGGISSFKTPKNLKKGGGKKGDDGNPKPSDRGSPRPGGGRVTKTKPKCRVSPARSTMRLGAGKNTIRLQSCVKDKTQTNEMVITSLAYAANAQPIQVKKECKKEHSQACFHYSSAIRVNPQWATLTCDEEAATIAHRSTPRATKVWSQQHKGKGWTDNNNRQQAKCDRDEYPPAYLLHNNHPAFINGGINSQGQLIRYLPDKENRGAGQMWKGACFVPSVADLSESQFRAKVGQAPNKQYTKGNKGQIQTLAAVTVPTRPEFTISAWGHQNNPPPNDGLDLNKCWPSGIASKDPGMALLTFDPWYKGQAPPYNYQAAYAKGTNGD